MSIQSEINRIAGAKSDIADAIEDKGVTVPSGTKLDGMANLIGQISGGSEKLNSTQAADAYDPTATYAVGDKVSYAGNVYSCISAISTPEAWDSTHWDQVDPIQEQVDDVRNTLNSKADEESLALRRTGSTNTGAQIESGTYFYLDGTLKHAIATIAQNASFTAQNCEPVTAGGLNAINDFLKVSYTEIANDTYLTTKIKLYKSGKFVFLSYSQDAYKIDANSWIVLGTVPFEYRPDSNLNILVRTDSTTYVRIQSNGTIDYYTNTSYSTRKNFQFFATYITLN